MTIRTFWIIFIKILGIWLLSGSLAVISQLFTAFYSPLTMGPEFLLFTIIPLIVVIGLYLVILWLFVFKATWLVDKLKLEQGFMEERIDLNIQRSTILKIAIIIIGGLMLVEALPQFCRNTYMFIQQRNSYIENPNTGWIIFDFARGVLGYLLMAFNKPIATFIEKQASTPNEGNI